MTLSVHYINREIAGAANVLKYRCLYRNIQQYRVNQKFRYVVTFYFLLI